MKELRVQFHYHHPLLAALALFTLPAMASESILTTTYQPLLIFPDSHIEVTPVVCLQWNASDPSGSIDLIRVPYIPPSDAPEHSTQDINLASQYGVKFSHSPSIVDDYSELTIDLTGSSLPQDRESTKIAIVRACLECLRLCCPGDRGFAKTPLTFKCADADREWLSKLVAEFNAHDRKTPFLTPLQASLTGDNSPPSEPPAPASH